MKLRPRWSRCRALALTLLLTGATGAPVGTALAGTGDLDSPVADAAQRDDLDLVRSLLRAGADVNAAQGDGMTALHWAARHGAVAMGEALLYAGAGVDAGTRIGGYTALHVAAREARRDFVALLLEAGSDPRAVTSNSTATPLHLAAGSGDPEIIGDLMRRGAEVDAREGAWGQTPLMFAAAYNRVEAVRTLIAWGADANATARAIDVVDYARADSLAEARLSQFLVDLEKQEGGGPDWQPKPSQVQAAIELSREIQRKWPDVPLDEDEDEDEDEGSEDGDEGAEAEAAEEGTQAEDEAANPEGEDADESTEASAPGEAEQDLDQDAPEAASDGAGESADTAGVGAEAGENDEEEKPRPLTYAQLVGNWGGLTPLLHAVRQGHREAVLELLEGGADINLPSGGDHTPPLLMATVNGQFDLAMLLLEHGADAGGASSAGATSLFAVLERQWAPRASYAHPTQHEQQESTHIEMLQALLEAGADPNVRLETHLWYMEYTFSVLRSSGINLKGATPFWRAAYALDIEAMRLLKNYGADPNIPTLKPPERRRRRPPPPDEEEASEQETGEQEGDEEQAAGDEVAAESGGTEAGEGEAGSAAEQVKNPSKGNAEGESADEEEEGEPESEEEKDYSGVPPVPVGGPAIHPLHAASGVGYGQSFAGNAHRYVPDNWLAAVKFLIEECDVEVDVRDANALTALHHAASRGDNELVLYLVGLGADVTALSRRGQTTADMANGPVQRVPAYPKTMVLLEKLGSKNNHECVSCE